MIKGWDKRQSLKRMVHANICFGRYHSFFDTQDVLASALSMWMSVPEHSLSSDTASDAQDVLALVLAHGLLHLTEVSY